MHQCVKMYQYLFSSLPNFIGLERIAPISGIAMFFFHSVLMRHKTKLAATTGFPDAVVTQFAELGKVASSIDVDDLSFLNREVVRSLRAIHLMKLRAPAGYADLQKPPLPPLLQLLPPHVHR